MKKTVRRLSFFTAALLAAVLVIAVLRDPAIVEAANKASTGPESTYAVSSVDKVISSLKKKSSSFGSWSRTLARAKDFENLEQSVVWKIDKKEKEDNGDTEQGSWDGNYTSKDLRLMSAIIYCEAGSMSEPARIAVANVIINRINDKKSWGHVSTVEEVIYDQKWGVQFTPILGNPSSMDKALAIYDDLDGSEEKWKYKQMRNCISSAKKAFAGEKAVPDSYLYFNGAIESTKAKCEKNGKSYKIIDHHIYF